MEETDIIICLKKITKDQKNIKEIIFRPKKQHNFLFVLFCFCFFFQCMK